MSALYIHIPLCKSRCYYCDFYSTLNIENKKILLESICKEIVLRKDYLKNETVKTIYFGGGTPSILTVEDIERILNPAFDTFQCDPI